VWSIPFVGVDCVRMTSPNLMIFARLAKRLPDNSGGYAVFLKDRIPSQTA